MKKALDGNPVPNSTTVPVSWAGRRGVDLGADPNESSWRGFLVTSTMMTDDRGGSRCEVCRPNRKTALTRLTRTSRIQVELHAFCEGRRERSVARRNF